MTKKTYMIIAAIVLLAVVGFILWGGKGQAPTLPEVAVPADTTDVIQQDLADINIGDIEAEFKDVDATINEL